MANVLSSDGSLTGIRTLTIRVDCGTFKSEIRDGSIDHRRLEGGGGKLFEKILRRGIVIEFFSGGSRFYTKQLASTFLLSAGHSFEAACTLLDPGIDISSPSKARFCSFSGIWLASRWCKNLTSRISSCRAEGFARPLRSTSSTTCGTRLYERSF